MKLTFLLFITELEIVQLLRTTDYANIEIFGIDMTFYPCHGKCVCCRLGVCLALCMAAFTSFSITPKPILESMLISGRQ